MISDGFKINVNRLNSDEIVLVLLEITHPKITDPLRLVNDNQEFIFKGDYYYPTSFSLHRQSDIESELPVVSLRVQNIGRELVRWIDYSGGGYGAKMKVIMARRSEPNIEEEVLFLGIEKTTITQEAVTFNLVIQNNLIKRSIRFMYDTRRNPGLF